MSGTPRTLREAIENGSTAKVSDDAVISIESHVLDFLRQGFGALYIELDDVLDYRALRKVRALAKRLGVEK